MSYVVQSVDSAGWEYLVSSDFWRCLYCGGNSVFCFFFGKRADGAGSREEKVGVHIG